ncbi:MAG: outer membrane lipoprotein carrier protein LolA [Candidatus Binatia bacterium]
MPCVAALIIAGFVLGIWSCAPARPAGGPVRPSKFALSDGALSQGRGVVELVRSLAQRIDRFRSFRSLARITYWSRDERSGLQGVILVRRPDRFRLETLSPLGAILILTADGEEVVGFHPREGIFYRGRSSKENLVRYTQIPLELRDLTYLLMGLPPVEIGGSWEGGGDRVERRLPEGGSEVVTFDRTMGIPVRWDRSGPDEDLELTVVFSEFVSTPAGPFPLMISLESYAQERRLEIRYREPEVNVALPASLFVQQRPNHVREVPLESLGG